MIRNIAERALAWLYLLLASPLILAWSVFILETKGRPVFELRYSRLFGRDLWFFRSVPFSRSARILRDASLFFGFLPHFFNAARGEIQTTELLRRSRDGLAPR
jgi:hypothetical protein